MTAVHIITIGLNGFFTRRHDSSCYLDFIVNNSIYNSPYAKTGDNSV